MSTPVLKPLGFLAMTLPATAAGAALGIFPGPIAGALGVAAVSIAAFGFSSPGLRSPRLAIASKRLAPTESDNAERWVVLTLNTRRHRVEAMTPIVAEADQLFSFLGERPEGAPADWWDTKACQADAMIACCQTDIEAVLGTFTEGLYGACVIKGERSNQPLIYMCYRESAVLRENARQIRAASRQTPNRRD